MSDAEKIATLVEREIERMTDTVIVARIRQLLVALMRSGGRGITGRRASVTRAG
jgi:hypothetical protein